MRCPNCQSENREGAKFCDTCGTRLASHCPACGSELRENARFCDNCGHPVAGAAATPLDTVRRTPKVPGPTAATSTLERFIPREFARKLEAARSSRAMEGERRIVTLLFCDVKDSTVAAQRLDPEEWTEIINGAFEYMIRPIYRYEGTVARMMGDGILAFFGAPIAHEDDAQRAVLAGLEIVESIREYRTQVKRQWDVAFDVRVGINTGLVVVGAVGSDLRMEYTAMGDAINLAARMEQAARPGTVQITEDSYRLVAPLFEVEPIGEVEVKGKSEPVMAYRVLRAKAQPGHLRGIEGLSSPLVGRDEEMGVLQAAVNGLHRGCGAMISVMGEAGLGKSRLLADLRDNSVSGSERGGLLWLEGRALSYETTTPYAPFIHLLQRYFDLAVVPNAIKYEHLRTCVEGTMPEQVEEIGPFLATMLALPLSGEDAERVRYLEPPQLRARVFAALVRFFERLAMEQPLVLVLDDLHWIDPTSLDLLGELLPLTERVPLLLVVLYRPRRQELSFRFHETAQRDYGHLYTLIELKPLDEATVRTLIGNLLHVEELPERVRTLILEKTDGNPFYVEEVIRSLLDARLVMREDDQWRATREIENIAVPDTLAGVITARLDRLDEKTRRVAQTAAVLGREFRFGTLAAVHDDPDGIEEALGELQRRELLREKSRLPERVLLFKHVLTQETAYSTLLLKRRRDLHRRVAEYLERQAGERASEIARHFLEAGAAQRAVPHLLSAGEQAAHAYSTAEAIGYFTRALDILEQEDDGELLRRAYEGLGGALTFANDIARAVETYQAMHTVAEARGDISMQVSALNKLSFIVALRLGQFPQAEKLLADADRLARAYQDKVGLSEMSLIRCMMCTAAADFEGVVHYMDETVQLGKELDEKEQMTLGLEHIANSLNFMTRFDEAWHVAQEALHLTRQIGNREHEAALLTSAIPIYHLRNGNLDLASQTAETGVALGQQIGYAQALVYGSWVLGQVALLRGEYERAIMHLTYSLEAAIPYQDVMPFMLVQPLGTLGSVYLDVSDDFQDRVAEYHQQALALLEHPAGVLGGGTAWADLGFCALQIGNVELADQLFQKGLTYPTMFQRIERPRFLLGSALAALSRQQWRAAAQHVAEADTFVKERAMQYLYPLVAFIEGQVHEARGDVRAALGCLARAGEQALEMQMRPLSWQVRVRAAKLLAKQGHHKAALHQYRQALTTIDEIAGLFNDEALRAAFIKSARTKLARR